MLEEERIIYESAITEYRQALAGTQWALAQANGRVKARDALIAELTATLEPHEAERAERPKPGPPPAH